MEARDRTVDIAKGLGILLVVLGHNGAIGDTVFQTLLYSFHMPLFLVLAGVYLKPGLGAALRSRGEGIVKPYLVVGFGVALFFWLKSALLGHHDAMTLEGIAASKAVGVLYGVGQTLDNVPLWFLPALFVAQAAAVALTGLAALRRPGVAALVVTAMLVVGVALIGHISRPFDVQLGLVHLPAVVGWPWSLDLVPVTGGLVLAGWACGGRIRRLRPRAPTVLASAMAFCAAHLLFPVGLDLNLRYVSAAPAVFVTAAAGTYLTLAAASAMARTGALADGAAALGRASLFLLLFHYMPQQETFGLMLALVGNVAVAGVTAFAAGLAVPLALRALARRVPPLAALLLPRPRGVPPRAPVSAG